jgi:hypothetical protein
VVNAQVLIGVGCDCEDRFVPAAHLAALAVATVLARVRHRRDRGPCRERSQGEQHEELAHVASLSAYMQRGRLAGAKVAPTPRQHPRARLRIVSSVLPTPPRLGFTVTETIRPPAPVEPDPFIAAPAPVVR